MSIPLLTIIKARGNLNKGEKMTRIINYCLCAGLVTLIFTAGWNLAGHVTALNVESLTLLCGIVTTAIWYSQR